MWNSLVELRSVFAPAVAGLTLICCPACTDGGRETAPGSAGRSGGSSGGVVTGGAGGSTTGETGGSSTTSGGGGAGSGGGGAGAAGVSDSGGLGTGGVPVTGGSVSGGVGGGDMAGGAPVTGGSTGTGGSSGAAGGVTGGLGAGGASGGAAGEPGASGSSGGSSLGAPTYETEFASGTDWGDRSDPNGSVEYGVSGGDDGNVAVLTFPGDPALGAEDNSSPSHATEIYWQEQLFGTFRVRLELAGCTAGEEVVNGIFTYSHGGDSNANGITDNSEIDIEILCGEPHIIFLTSWTDYDSDTSFRKWSRAIDTRTGDYRESPNATAYGLGPVLGNIPGANVPGFPESGRFYEMGFDWHPDHIRWFMVFDTEEVTLWDFADVSLIPQNPASFLFNVWHAPTHWFEGGAADYPASDAVMRVDWFRYWAYP